MDSAKTYDELLAENEELRWQLEETSETIHAIRSGQVDALVVQSDSGTELYTLKTADQTYRVFIEKMNEGAVTLNDSGIILYSNSMFATMVGRPLSTVIGRAFSDFIPAECKEDFIHVFTKGWVEDAKVELLITGQDRLIPCNFSVTTLALDEGVSLSVIITDLTVQKQSQELLRINNERLEKTNKALHASNHDLQQFASVASHDLQEPLRKIRIFTDLLIGRHGEELKGDSVEYLEKISASSARMKRLITDILAYSSLALIDEEFGYIPLGEIVNEVLDDYELMIREKAAQISVGPLPTVEVNRGQMRQVFQNLIGNALKFCRKDVVCTITVDAVVSGEACTITIRDNGIGFDEQYSANIFSLFHRLNSKDEYEGSGIGLAVTKKIIDKHAGSISVHSRVGEGSEFKITLPLHHPRASSDSL